MNSCTICKSKIDGSKKFNNIKHISICKTCFNNSKDNYISYSMCNKKYILTKNDLKNIKKVYFPNPNNKNKYYLFSDVHNVIVQKYGDHIKLKNIIEKKESKINKIRNTKALNEEKKKKELQDILSDYRLDLQHYGDHYEYIHYGTQTIKDIIYNHHNKDTNKGNRIQKLANKLEPYGIVYDENNKYCYDYVNKLGSKKLDEIVKHIVKEYYFSNVVYK